MTLNRRAFTGMLAGFGIAASAIPSRAQATVTVTIKNAPKMGFSPDVVNIKAGDTVKWNNPGYVTHTVTFDPALAAKAGDVALPDGVAPFASGNLEEDGSFSHTFTAKGTYKYVCQLHEAMGMIGTVIVS